MMAANDMTVVADPTKDFFIHMLTRDIGLSRSILDLVDNSIDGALRVRGGNQFDGLHVAIVVGPDRFSIEDNCGGILIDIARKYAFRFGRPPEAERTKHSIGQFGVGSSGDTVQNGVPGTPYKIVFQNQRWKGIK